MNAVVKNDSFTKDWHPLEVIAELGKAGWTLEALAAANFLKSGGTFSKALRNPAPMAEKRIAEALGIHPSIIWPSRYDEKGNPKPRGLRANSRLRLSRVK